MDSEIQRARFRLSAFRRRHPGATGGKGSLNDELPFRAHNPRLVEDGSACGVEADLGQADAPFDSPGPVVEVEGADGDPVAERVDVELLAGSVELSPLIEILRGPVTPHGRLLRGDHSGISGRPLDSEVSAYFPLSSAAIRATCSKT